MDRIWLITGVSSGLGSHLAKHVASSGDTVVGTVRKPEQVKVVDDLVPGKTFGIQLDVNDHDEGKRVVRSVVERFGRVDVLVNNAGYGLLGAVEETSLAESRAQMETNFFGALAMTQAVLPDMRSAKRGHILQISSIAGIVGAPGLGLYDASKHALEGFSEALYHEVKPLGIAVTIVEPGPFRTNWAGGSMAYVSKKIDDYEPTAGKMRTNLSAISGKQPGDPAGAAKVMLDVVRSEAPPLRVALGKKALGAISDKVAWVQKDLDEWREASLSADFPE